MTDIFLSPCARWKKPRREDLTTQQYFADYKLEQSKDLPIQVFRGVGEGSGGLPEPKGSLKGSILAKLSLVGSGSQGSGTARTTPTTDRKGLLDSMIDSPSEASDVEGLDSTRL